MLGANAVLMDAYNTDVRPLLRRVRARTWGSTPTRSAAYQRSGYLEQVRAERVGGTQAGWGA